jgi:hypothetical protein
MHRAEKKQQTKITGSRATLSLLWLLCCFHYWRAQTTSDTRSAQTKHRREQNIIKIPMAGVYKLSVAAAESELRFDFGFLMLLEASFDCFCAN